MHRPTLHDTHREGPPIVRQLLPSASTHVALALVDVPGPVHTVEPQPYYRFSFNLGPSYGFEITDSQPIKAMHFRHHSLMVIPPDVGFTHRSSQRQVVGNRPRPARLATFRVSDALVSRTALDINLPAHQARLSHRVVEGDEVLRLLAQALYADLHAHSPDGQKATESTAMALLGRLLRREHGGPLIATASPAARAQAHMDQQFATAVTLEQLAEIAGMSVFHFCRVFREHTGITPYQYLLSRRVAQARHMLWSCPDLTMLQVSLACGFGSASHFSAQFKKHTGQTPLQWQRSH
jgi:AraC family transcriptional regulator